MERNFELQRDILQCIENDQKYWEVLIVSYEEDEITEHAFLLNKEGFIDGLKLAKCHGGGWKFVPAKRLSLTMRGYDFLSRLKVVT
ncbi:Uncharacterised protein [Shewanella baltica]|jgi:hypothetical protein|uniref:DUF2513 domain-containing protein n=1 Tax=Shewanella TaxID=22 RepID=UPI000F6B63B7|nr:MULTISPECIES: DUF2513 domain-containing protein [Shewanella]WVI93916.1 DUF2513 domain-containing protein [Shewanella oncorhynchi]CAD6364352.1 hypothetical protein SHEWT2_02045 [Shewanella hafniensis]VEF27692.1 Uncharacterised protein [Shewanella baltica]